MSRGHRQHRRAVTGQRELAGPRSVVVPPRRRFRWRRRLAIYSLSLLLVCLGLADFYGETIGLPAQIERDLEQRLAERGIMLQVKNVRCGLFNGVVLEGVALADAEIPGWPLFAASRLRCDLAVDWARWRPRLAGLNIEEGQLRLMLFPESGQEGWYDLLTIAQLEARLEYATDREIRIEYLSGELAGILIKATGSVTLPLPGQSPPSTDLGERPFSVSARPFVTRITPALRVQLAMLLDKFQRQRGEVSPRCQMKLQLRLDEPQASRAELEVELPRLSYGHLVATDIQGLVRFQAGQLELQGLAMNLGDDERLQVDGIYRLADQRLCGTARGRISPARLVPLIESEWGATLTTLLAAESTPGEITATFEDCRPGSGQFRGTLAFTLPRLQLGPLACRNLNGEIRIPEDARNDLFVPRFQVEVEGGGVVTLSGKFDRRTGVIIGDLSGQLPGRLLHELPQAAKVLQDLPVDLRDSQVKFAGKLDQLVVANLQFRGNLNLTIDQFQLGAFACRNLVSEIQLPDDGGKTIVLSQFRTEFVDGGEVAIQGQFDRPAGILSGTVAGSMSGKLLHAQPHVADALRGVPLDMRGGSVHLAGRVNRLALADLRVEGEFELKADRLRFQEASFAPVQVHLTLSEGVIRGRELLARHEDGAELGGGFAWYPGSGLLEVEFSCRGAPQFAPQLLAKENRAFLDQLFAQVGWPEELDAAELEGTASVIMGEHPFFMMAADVAMRDFIWRKVPFSSGAARIYLDSESLLLIPAMIMERPEGRVLLSLSYDQRQQPAPDVASSWFPQDPGPRLRLKLDFDNTLGGDAFLSCLYPDWRPGMSGLDLSHSFPATGHGVVDYLQVEKSMIEAKVLDAAAAWRGIPMEHAKAGIFIGHRGLSIPDLKAKVCGGDLALAYQFDDFSRSGRVDATLVDAEFPLVMVAIGGKKDKDAHGQLSGKLGSDLSQEPGQSLQFHGDGSIAIREANLWKVPVLSEFSALLRRGLGIDDWGEISQLDADFNLRGDHLRSENIRTDGTVIALESKGEYFFASDDYDFTIRAKVLRDAMPMNLLARLFDPLGWLLETRVRRQGGQVSWEQISGVRKLLEPKPAAVKENP